MVGGFYLVKNHLYERYSYDESWIYLVEDISPDDGDDGEPCFYRVMESPSDKSPAPYMPRYMSVGDIWNGPSHWAQFYNLKKLRKADAAT